MTFLRGGQIETKKGRTPWWQLAALAASVVVTVAIMAEYAPVGIDWWATFSRLSLRDPFAVSTFVNPPFTLLFLPHSALPLNWGNAVNLALNIMVLAAAALLLKGGWPALLLVFTSPVFFDLARTNNIDWLPLLGLLLAPRLGALLLIVKPQSLGGALLILAKRDWKVLLLPGAALLVSFMVWGNWPAEISAPLVDRTYNFSPFPVGVPYGLFLLWQAWKNEDTYLAAVSTPLLVPYIAPYSLTGVLCVLACRDRKAAYWLYFAIWAFTIIDLRRMG